MNTYVATFHTHLSALMSDRSLKAKGVDSRMMPVPRKLSSSCGTCVRYRADEPCLAEMDADVEAVYEELDDGNYAQLMTNE